jgi:hypothetical protein
MPPTCGLTCKFSKKGSTIFGKQLYPLTKKKVTLLLFGNNVMWNGECIFEKWKHVLKNEWLS